LSNDLADLAAAVRQQHFDAEACHEYAKSRFSAHRMATDYLAKYQQVVSGIQLNQTRLRKSPIDLIVAQA
jgi:hypothetical protein